MNRTRSNVVLSFVVVLAALLTLSGPASAGLLSRPRSRAAARRRW